jgi:hypothetical protein
MMPSLCEKYRGKFSYATAEYRWFDPPWLLAMPLAGLLGLGGLYSTSKVGRRGILSSGDNQAIVSTGYFVSQLLGNGLALMPLIFGVMALFAYLGNNSERALALGARD